MLIVCLNVNTVYTAPFLYFLLFKWFIFCYTLFSSLSLLLYTANVPTAGLIKDDSDLIFLVDHLLFNSVLVTSGKMIAYRSICCRSSRMLRSFFPQAVRLVNGLCPLPHTHTHSLQPPNINTETVF